MLNNFFKKLRRQGIKLWLSCEEGGGQALKFKAYRGAPLAQEDREELRNKKTAVIAWLNENPSFFDYIPLSKNQKSLWLVDRLDNENTAYNLTHAVQLADGIDQKILQQAFGLLCKRHSILRTAYTEIDSEPLQKVCEDVQPLFIVEDQYLLDNEHIITWAKKNADRPFDLGRGDVCRANFMINHCGGHAQTIFQFTIHHIVADFWSCEVLFDELLGIYKDLEQQGLPSASVVEHDYFDWSQAQHQWLAGEESEDARAFWQSILSDGVETLELTTDYSRPTVQTYEGEELSFCLDSEQSETLRLQAKTLGVTPYVFFLTVFQVLLHRYSGQSEFLIGTPTSGRIQREFQRTVGYLVNPIVLRCDLTGRPSFKDLVERVNIHSKNVLEHQSLPFSSVLELLDVPRDPSRTPLFQHMFTLTRVHQQDHAHFATETFLSEQRGAAHDLNLVILDDGQGFTGKWRYNCALFSKQSVQGVLDNYVDILAQVSQFSNISTVDISLSKGGLSQLNGQASQQIEGVESCGAIGLFEKQVHEAPENIAFRCGETELSYGMLNESARLFAESYLEQGVKVGQCIAICLPRGADLIVSVIALWKLGASYAAFDPEWPEERIQQLCDEGDLDGLITSKDHVPKGIKIILPTSAESVHNTNRARVRFHPKQSAYRIYTSGSTGKPKAVCVTQFNLAHYARAVLERLALPEKEKNLSFMSLGTLATDLGHTAIYGALLNGYCLHLPTDEQANDPSLLAESVRKNPIACLKLTPSHVRAMSDVLADILPSHCMVLGGEALTTEISNEIKKVSDTTSKCRIINHYGPTETTVGVLSTQVSSDSSVRPCPIGTPFNNTQAYILDDHLNLLPVGAAGELYLGGQGLSEGYFSQAGQTAEYFVPSPFAQELGERLYRSGDRARLLLSGEIEYLGRIDHQVKVRGFRVELGEIEAQLRQIENIDEAVVVLHKHEQSGSDQLLAYVQVCDGFDLEVTNDILQAQLPEHMLPSSWQVVEKFSRLSSGKIDRRNLPKPVFNEEATSNYLPPRNDIEKAFYDIWSRVLNRNDFGVEDSFFDLGGDSILSLQIITQAKKIGIGVTPKTFFDARTIAGLAQSASIQALNKQIGAAEDLSGVIPLTPIQHWFFEQQKSDLAHWNQTLIFSPKQELDSAKLKSAVQDLLKHHDALRLSFSAEGEQLYTKFEDLDTEKTFVKIKVNDEFRSRSQLINSSWFDGEIKNLQTNFVLDSAPMFKVALFEVGDKSVENESLIVLTAHHLLVDGVSWRIILEDLEMLYKSSQNAVVSLDKSDSYKRWSHLLQSQVKDNAAKIDQDLWLSQVPDQNTERYLPAYDHAKNTVGDSATLNLSLDAQYTKRLLTDALNTYRFSVNECLITALVPILGKLFKGEPLAFPVEMEGHGRDNRLKDGDKVDVSRTVGWFTSRYPVLVDGHFSDWPSTAAQVKKCLRALPNNGITYGMQQYLTASKLPQSRLMTFNYLGQVDSQLENSTLFNLCEHMAPHMRSGNSQRTHIIDLNMQVINGCLHMLWTYPKHALDQVYMDHLAEQYCQRIKALIDHCLDPNSGEVEASDFDDADISDDEFDLLLEELS